MNNLSIHHSFDINLAAKYGIPEAILIHHFAHWITLNMRKGINKHNGKVWTYQTLDEICEHFSYLSRDQVFNAIERLCRGKSRRSSKNEPEFEPILVKGNFNSNPYDRTTWYAFTDEFSSILTIANTKSDNCQTDIKEQILKTDTTPYYSPPKQEKNLNPRKTQSSKPPPVKKVKLGEVVEMPTEKYEMLATKFGKERIDALIAKMNDYCLANAKKYKDYGAAVQYWLRNEEKWANQKSQRKEQKNAHLQESNKEYAKQVTTAFQKLSRGKPKFVEVENYPDQFAILTTRGQKPPTGIRYTEYGFKEQVNNALRRWGLGSLVGRTDAVCA